MISFFNQFLYSWLNMQKKNNQFLAQPTATDIIFPKFSRAIPHKKFLGPTMTKKLGFSFLAAAEYYKAKYGLKIKAFYIPSAKNTFADALSRGKTPIWLKDRGTEVKINLVELFKL